jgi:predicted acetyltransferase
MNTATTKDISEIKSLWKTVFGDSEDFISRFIAHFGIENGYVSKQNGEIAAMLFALPVCWGIARNAPTVDEMWYVYACATHPQYRNRGLMSKLLETVYREACSKNVAGIFLRAANPNLENYYRKLGFEDFFYRKIFFINRKEGKGFTKDAKNISHTLLFASLTSHLIPHASYLEKRAQKLKNTCFVNWDEDYFRFLDKEGVQFCEYENTIFSFKMLYNNIIIEELLGDTPHEHIAQLLFEYFPDFETVHIRLQGNETCCGQIKWCNTLIQKTQSGYFAFAME